MLVALVLVILGWNCSAVIAFATVGRIRCKAVTVLKIGLPLLRRLWPQVKGRFPSTASMDIRLLTSWLDPLCVSLVELGPPPRGTTEELAENLLRRQIYLNLEAVYR